MDKKSKRIRVSPSNYFNGDEIRKLREERDLSLDALAKVVGTTRANISKWERSRQYVAISFDLFMALARALYIPPEELARRLSTPPAQPPASSPTAKSRRA